MGVMNSCVPNCYETIECMAFPSLDEVRANWDKLSDRECSRYERIEARKARFDDFGQERRGGAGDGPQAGGGGEGVPQEARVAQGDLAAGRHGLAEHGSLACRRAGGGRSQPPGERWTKTSLFWSLINEADKVTFWQVGLKMNDLRQMPSGKVRHSIYELLSHNHSRPSTQ